MFPGRTLVITFPLEMPASIFAAPMTSPRQAAVSSSPRLMPLRKGIVSMTSRRVRTLSDTAICASAAGPARSERMPTMITLSRRCGTPKASACMMKSDGRVASLRLALPFSIRMARGFVVMWARVRAARLRGLSCRMAWTLAYLIAGNKSASRICEHSRELWEGAEELRALLMARRSAST